jgi:hypothetical protein
VLRAEEVVSLFVRRLACLALISLLILPQIAVADGGDASPMQSSYRLETSTMGAAGAPGAGTAYRGKGTMAQPTPVGVGSADGKTLYAGFWSKHWILASVLEGESPGLLVNQLYQNFPNPFVGSTSISFSVMRESHVELEVFDIRGRKVVTLVSGAMPAGRHLARWDGRDEAGHSVSPGVYFYRFRAGSYGSVKKLLVLK